MTAIQSWSLSLGKVVWNFSISLGPVNLTPFHNSILSICFFLAFFCNSLVQVLAPKVSGGGGLYKGKQNPKSNTTRVRERQIKDWKHKENQLTKNQNMAFRKQHLRRKRSQVHTDLSRHNLARKPNNLLGRYSLWEKGMGGGWAEAEGIQPENEEKQSSNGRIHLSLRKQDKCRTHHG